MTTPYSSSRPLGAHLALAHILGHRLGIALLGWAIAAAAARAVTEDRVGSECNRRFGAQFDVLAFGVEDITRLASRLATSEPFWSPAVPVRQDGKGHFVIDKSVVAPQPQAAAILSSPF